MELTLKVKRQDGYQSYQVDVEPTATVFDALVQAREECDGSLAFRGNCFTGFCGDCVMRANGRLTLMCMLRVERVMKDNEITIDPAPYAKVVQDTLLDTHTFLWDKYKSMHPWIQSDGASRMAQAPTTGNGAGAFTEEAMADVRRLMRCTMCGLCDYGCSVIDVDLNFLGPAALMKSYRFIADPRDTATKERLAEAGDIRGMWDCVHCWEASEHCPYGIDPTHRIMEMRDMAAREGVKSGPQNPQAARHYDSFEDSVRHSGWLDERKLAVDTEGLLGSLRFAGTALKMLRRGKLTLKPHEKRPGADQIAEIIDKVEQDAKAHKLPRPRY